MGKRVTKKREAEWAEAKQKCRLNAETLRMAKELGLNPRSLIKNIPSKAQPWKAPVHVWIREMYEKRGSKRGPKAARLQEERESLASDRPVIKATRQREGESRGRQGRGADQQPNTDSPNQVDDRVGEDEFSFAEEGGWFDAGTPNRRETAAQNESMLQRREHFRIAAQRVAKALSSLRSVRKVVLFGSVVAPLAKEIPRFREYRRAGITLWHECNDVDLAVWMDEVSDLRQLQRARSRALNDLLRDLNIGVAHHQVEIFIFKAGSDQYLGRLCCFSQCPKDKPECEVAGCGATLFLKQHEDFTFRPEALAPDRTEDLYDRDLESGAVAEDNEIPF